VQGTGLFVVAIRWSVCADSLQAQATVGAFRPTTEHKELQTSTLAMVVDQSNGNGG